MTEINKEIVENALKQIIDPNTDEDPVSSKSVKKIEIEGGRVTIDLTLGYPAKAGQMSTAGCLLKRLNLWKVLIVRW